MIDVSELMDDPDFAQDFQIRRIAGAFDHGRWVPGSPTVIDLVGIIQPATLEDALKILPEGSRLDNLIVVYCATEIVIDNADTTQSDVVLWHGAPYRAIKARRWGDNGFWQVWAEGFIE